MALAKHHIWGSSFGVALGGGILLALQLGGCVAETAGETADEEPVGEAKQATYANATTSAIAQAFRPRFNFGTTECWPLSFQEISSSASSTDRDALQSKCNSSYNDNFVVFASVQRATGSDSSYWSDDSFRVTYGVAFGQQNTSIGSGDAALFTALGYDVGTHGEDAQYLVVDVVNGSFNSAWADAHRGYYSRVKSELTMHTDNRVTVWPGRYYHPLYLVIDRYGICENYSDVETKLQALCGLLSCNFGLTPYNNCGGGYDELTNFGDDVGSTYSGDGKLVVVEDVCATTGNSYTSPDGITYSGSQLQALKGYIGCDGDSTDGVWSGSYFMSKTQYSSPYSLAGCKSGDTGGGDICNASAFGSTSSDTWTTHAGSSRYLEPYVVGNADVDYAAGTPFNDMNQALSSYSVSSATIRTGSRVDAVSLTYANGTTLSHGGTGGTAQTLTGLASDPIVSVYMCEGSTSGRERAGYINLMTLNGQSLSGGEGTSNCQYIHPSNKQLFGYFGRSGTELDVLGTLWKGRSSSSVTYTYYDIKAKHSGKCLDVSGASTSNNADVFQYTCGGSANQNWRLVAGMSSGGVQYYQIKAMHSGKCIDVASGSTANYADVNQYSCTNGGNQNFQLLSDGNGYYSLVAAHSGKCLDISGASTADSANVLQYSCGGSDNQKFQLVAHSN